MVDLDHLVVEMVDWMDGVDRYTGEPRLVRMVDWMDGTDRYNGEPRLVRVDEVPGEPGVERIASTPLCGSLLGWIAPPRCQAVGVIARGRAWTLADVDRLPPATLGGPLADGVTVAVIVGRPGTVAARVHLPDRPPLREAPAGGQLLDCLKRSLRLPTPPPPSGAAVHLHLSLWLDAVRSEAERRDRRLSWREVVLQHPAGRALSGGGADRSVEAVIDATEQVAVALDWDLLRRWTVSGPLAGRLVPADLAAWMDAGMFARWVIGEVPDPDGLVELLQPALAPATAQRLQRVVGSWR